MYTSDTVKDAVVVVDAGGYEDVDKHCDVVGGVPTELIEAARSYSLHVAQMPVRHHFRHAKTRDSLRRLGAMTFQRHFCSVDVVELLRGSNHIN